MPWVVGIDEAGYGPNLGPLVQAAGVVPLPDDDPDGWRTLASVMRRSGEPVDGRLLVDDSKKVYARGGLPGLERVVWTVGGWEPGATFGEWLAGVVVPTALPALAAEPWFDPAEPLPLRPVPAVRLPLPVRLVAWPVPPAEFNRLCDQAGSKAAVLARGLAELVRAVWADLPRNGTPVVIHCDKHGGRNYYAALLAEVFPGGAVRPLRESAAESTYEVGRLGRPVRVVFRPRAESAGLPVALASVLAKYLRELCMRQFNRFWAGHVPGLRPTAGYPADARRFYAAIQPVLGQLGLNEDHVWRRR